MEMIFKFLFFVFCLNRKPLLFLIIKSALAKTGKGAWPFLLRLTLLGLVSETFGQKPEDAGNTLKRLCCQQTNHTDSFVGPSGKLGCRLGLR